MKRLGEIDKQYNGCVDRQYDGCEHEQYGSCVDERDCSTFLPFTRTTN